MFARLIGSAPGHHQSVGSTSTALVLHATLIGLAIQMSGRIHPRILESVVPVDEHLLPYRVPEPVRSPSVRRPGTPLRCECTIPEIALPNVRSAVPVEIPSSIPDPGPVAVGIAGAPASASAGDPEGGSFAPTADVPARPLPGNPQPVYPSLLRSARVEGVIAAHFVVDSTGRVDARGITFESGGDALFESSVRRALLASRYEPAHAGGRAVAVRVQQEFAFRITP